MYLIDGGLGAFTITGGCCAWDKDRQSFSSAVAQHYLKTELNKSLKPKSVWCAEDGTYCSVKFPDDTDVMVSFVEMPNYLIARASGPNMPRREYNHKCSGNIELTLSPHKSN